MVMCRHSIQPLSSGEGGEYTIANALVLQQSCTKLSICGTSVERWKLTYLNGVTAVLRQAINLFTKKRHDFYSIFIPWKLLLVAVLWLSICLS